MNAIPGAKPPPLYELARAEDRISFIYVERCAVNRDANAITATDERGTVHIPAASLGALILGPGATVSHQAMVLLAESGSTAVWVGERGVRYYAHGRSLTHSSRLLEAQAEAVTNRHGRLRVARSMYAMRFPDEDVSELTMQQLRGREGARVRRVYRHASRTTGVAWEGRNYDPTDFDASDDINRALSAATTCLYGVAHSVIVALGCSPGLGFVHTGHERSFVYDIADLYKAEVAIPIAFAVAAEHPDDIGGTTRRAVRDAIRSGAIMSRAAHDIRRLLLPDSTPSTDIVPLADVVQLWDERQGAVAAGHSYAMVPQIGDEDDEW
ncbi:MAG: type I-E CRISPR-associated endonuclease Cas1e [Propionibacteriaceae bacterium]|jgi:CRISPR-associated protein Cas1|nr:type I-E CRISPR-associated endonuclease Cas1e [Propionibacteriaceae bacterium]